MTGAGATARLAALIALALLAGAAGCARSHPVLLEGDADSARVANNGDLAAATAVAERHCARFERVARFKMGDIDTDYFDCVKR